MKLIKLGGAALQDQSVLENLCANIADIYKFEKDLIIVHGGGPAINDELLRHGISWEFKNGLRVTTPQMMKVIESVLVGQVNQNLVRTLNKFKVPAMGISGASNQFLKCKQLNSELGLVGDIENVNTEWLQKVIKATGVVPVIAPIGFDCESGLAFNINADWAAIRIAESMAIEKVYFVTDQNGILDHSKQLLQKLNPLELQKLIDKQVVTGGMLTKVNTILHGLNHGVEEVNILNGSENFGLFKSFKNDLYLQTKCTCINK